MSWEEFFILFICCVVTMLLSRVLPLFLLKGRDLPENVSKALGFIPPAVFAALVANDLLSPTMFNDGVWEGSIPLIAAAAVVVVALKTKSLIWCVVVGVAGFAVLSLISNLLLH